MKENALKAYQRIVEFTSEFCPDWSTSETAAEVDRLFRYLDGEELDPADVEIVRNKFRINGKIRERKIVEHMARLESMLVRQALEAFYSKFFDVKEEDCDEKPRYDNMRR